MVFLINLIKSLLLIFRYVYSLYLQTIVYFFISLKMSFFADQILQIQLLIFTYLFCDLIDELNGKSNDMIETLKVFDLYLINFCCIFFAIDHLKMY